MTDNLLQFKTTRIHDASKLENLQSGHTIRSTQLLRLDYLKIFLVAPVLILCSGLVVGVLAIHLVIVRKWLFFRQTDRKQQADYIAIQGQDESLQIESIVKDSITEMPHYFYRGLMYLLYQQKVYRYPQDLKLQIGNRHDWSIQNVFYFMVQTLTKPIFIFQHIICIIYLSQTFIQFAIVMWCFSFGTTLINYILMYISFLRVRANNVKEYQVMTADGAKSNLQLNPGDLWLPKAGDIVPCDCYVVEGVGYCDQSNLTGQTTPIRKVNTQSQKIYDQTNWLYEGSKILQCRNLTSHVVFTGFQTRKGRILRSLLIKEPNQGFFVKAMNYQLFLFIVGMLIYFFNLISLVNNKAPSLLILFRFFQTLSWAVPPAMPIYFNICLSFGLVRLGSRGVLGTKPGKIPPAGRLKTICFDKTGTLTVNKVVFNSFFVKQNQKFKECFGIKQNQDIKLLRACFACCNDCLMDKQEVKGEDIELEMFKLSAYKLQAQGQKNLFVGQLKLLVHKVYKFDSDLKRMSVLVQNVNNSQLYLFSKGAPQILQRLSVQQTQGLDFLVQKVSMEGFRNISYCYRKLSLAQLDRWIKADRQLIQKQLIFMALGAFANKLKDDTCFTMKQLQNGGIDVKMITGDNPYIGAEVANRCGMMNSRNVLVVNQIQNYQFKGHSIDFGQKYYDTVQYVCLAAMAKKIDDSMLGKITVFARATPDDKAQIVKRLMQIEASKINGFVDQQLKNKYAVGMLGDGANDVLAINVADVGMGFVGCQSSFGAGFSLQNLSDIVNLCSQGRATLSNSLDVFRYYGICQFVRLLSAMMLQNFNSYFTQNQLVWSNYASILVTSVLLTLSSGQQKLRSFQCSDIFFSTRSNLIYFGYVMLSCIGQIIVTVVVKSSFLTQYKFTVLGFNVNNQMSISHFLFIMMIYSFMPFYICEGQPYKKRLIRNYLLIIWQLIVVGLNLALFFLPRTDPLSFYVFGMGKQLGVQHSSKVLWISCGTLVAMGILQLMVDVLFPPKLLLRTKNMHK